MAVAFDTLRFAEKLRAGGIPESEAKAFTEAVAAAMQEEVDRLATKQDLNNLEVALRSDMEKMEVALRSDMEKMEVALRSDMEKMEVALRSDMEGMKIALRAEMEGMKIALRAEMERMTNKITLRLGYMLAAGFTILAVLNKVL